MEKVIEEKEPLLNQEQNSNGVVLNNSNKGGFRTLPFIIANEACEKVASIGLMSLVYVGVMQGRILLWLTTIVPLSSPMCSNSCNSPTTFHLLMLHSSFALMSIGAGGIRSSSLAFGLDQLSKRSENTMSQSSFLVLEATSMNCQIGANFKIPRASFFTFMILSLILWVILYDRLLVPLSSRILGRATCLGAKQKLGVSLFSCCIASLAIVENIRCRMAINQGYSEQPEAVANMSAMWLYFMIIYFDICPSSILYDLLGNTIPHLISL